MILTDTSIQSALSAGRLKVEPFDPVSLQPSSIDLRLSGSFRIFNNHNTGSIDPRKDQGDLTTAVEIEDGDEFILHPGEFVLGATYERVVLPDDLVGRLEGRSSLGRIGLMIHSTAGFVDPGWDGQLTLELTNVATLPILLAPYMRIAQLSLFQATAPAARPYGSLSLHSKYQGQVGPTPSRFFKDKERGPSSPIVEKDER